MIVCYFSCCHPEYHPPVYQWLLIRRYLTSKIMPLLASLAVVLCTAMVLIVWSVMGGFLAKLVDSGRTLVGDVLISWPNTGFAYYDDLIDRLEKDNLIAGAAPMIESYGLIGLPNGMSENVLIKGIDGDRYARVTEYKDSLWWKPIDKPLRKDVAREDPRLKGDQWASMLEHGLKLTRPDPVTGEPKPAVVLGIEVSGQNNRRPEGFFVPYQPMERLPSGEVISKEVFAPANGFVTLSVPPRDSKGIAVDMQTRRFPVANEFYSGLFEIDHKTVLVELGALQKMLRMEAGKRLKDVKGRPFKIVKDPLTGIETTVTNTEEVDEPARVTTVLVRGKADSGAGEDAQRLADRCRSIYALFAKDHVGVVPDEYTISIRTWEDQNRTLITAVKKETGLVLFIFSFISMTAVFLVLAIFWSMVSEKTKDVGVLRSLGASRAGVAGLWLGYGLAIGIVGAVLGGALAYAIVLNINPIHEWIGTHLGFYIWDPRVYYFTEIPSKVDPNKAKWVLAGGMLSSVVGALIPALRAAWLDPVKALRFE